MLKLDRNTAWTMKGCSCLLYLLLERKVGKDWSERLAVRGPVGVKFYNPGDTTVSLQLLLITHIRSEQITQV